MSGRRLLFLVTEDWYFCSHRLDLARAARDAGFTVCVATRVADHAEAIRDEGLELQPLDFERSMRHPLKDYRVRRAINALYHRLRPELIHHVALKPVLLGSAAAAALRIPTINALTGLGYVFSSDDSRARLLRPAVRAMLGRALCRPRAWTLVQNRDDAALVSSTWPDTMARLRTIRGSGVDTARFRPAPAPPPGPPVVMLVARMLRDKGVYEFVAAARALAERGVEVRCVLVGDTDAANPAGIAPAQLRAWHESGAIEWWGRCTDMIGTYSKATIVCLPSYREGLPKVLLEASACGLPVVAADVPGCREAVRDGRTGLLVPPRDAGALAEALELLLAQSELARRCGEAGRRLMQEAFSCEVINGETLALYETALKGR